jgi:hypothetical protein
MESNPVAPPAPYLGGKSRLAARIIERLSGITHECYVEPFIGMGGGCVNKRRIRPFISRSDNAQSSRVSSTDAPPLTMS